MFTWNQKAVEMLSHIVKRIFRSTLPYREAQFVVTGTHHKNVYGAQQANQVPRTPRADRHPLLPPGSF